MARQLRMFPSDFGFRRCLSELEQTTLCTDDYNLPDVFSGGAILTCFNAFDPDRMVEAQDQPSVKVPVAMRTRAYQRTLFCHHLPQYLTPGTSPVLVGLDDRSKQRFLSQPVEGASIKAGLRKLIPQVPEVGPTMKKKKKKKVDVGLTKSLQVNQTKTPQKSEPKFVTSFTKNALVKAILNTNKCDIVPVTRKRKASLGRSPAQKNSVNENCLLSSRKSPLIKAKNQSPCVIRKSPTRSCKNTSSPKNVHGLLTPGKAHITKSPRKQDSIKAKGPIYSKKMKITPKLQRSKLIVKLPLMVHKKSPK